MPEREPRHFFLNEQHELALLNPDSLGRSPTFASIDWTQHADQLRGTFARAVAPSPSSPDPTERSHRFIVAVPAPLTKISKGQKAAATGGRVPFEAHFGGDQANVLGRLGFDLIGVEGKNAVVHIPAQRLPQLQAKLIDLERASRREKDRWINVGEFLPIEWTDRVSSEWLSSIEEANTAEVYLRFYSVVPRLEIQGVLDALRRYLGREERFLRNGRDFSGRYWCVVQARKETILRIAHDFPSVQSIHPPLSTPLAGSMVRRPPRGHRGGVARILPDVSALPTVGVLDSGIPEDHPTLAPYRT